MRSGFATRWSVLLTFKNLTASSNTNPFSGPQGFSTIRLGGFASIPFPSERSADGRLVSPRTSFPAFAHLEVADATLLLYQRRPYAGGPPGILRMKCSSGQSGVTLSTTSGSSRRRCAAVRLPRVHRFAPVPAASCALRRSLASLGHPNHSFGPIGRILVWGGEPIMMLSRTGESATRPVTGDCLATRGAAPAWPLNFRFAGQYCSALRHQSRTCRTFSGTILATAYWSLSVPTKSPPRKLLSQKASAGQRGLRP